MRLTVASLRRVVKADLPIEFVPQQLTSYGGLELLRRYFRPARSAPPDSAGVQRVRPRRRLRRGPADVLVHRG